jgi:hypothetical protein
MWSTYLVGTGIVVLLALGWVAVQGAWRRAFAGLASDPDVLAGRMGCHGTPSNGADAGAGCGCKQACDRRLADGGCPVQEEVS